jgi:hypothetical protein
MEIGIDSTGMCTHSLKNICRSSSKNQKKLLVPHHAKQQTQTTATPYKTTITNHCSHISQTEHIISHTLKDKILQSTAEVEDGQAE